MTSLDNNIRKLEDVRESVELIYRSCCYASCDLYPEEIDNLAEILKEVIQDLKGQNINSE